jgi:acetyl-CoA C-acetyltransferase
MNTQHDTTRPGSIGAVPDDTTVAVGVGLVTQREENPQAALEPIELMLRAVVLAGRDAGSEDHLRHVGKISVPKGRWRYRDPGRLIARRIGADDALTEIATVGVLQQTLIGDACRAVRAGEHRAVVVVGGEAGYRLQRAKKLGIKLEETEAEGTADSVLKPQAALRSQAEEAAGLHMAVGLYAMLDCAFRTASGDTLDQRRDQIGALYEDFSRIASANPHAWSRTLHRADEINTPSATNHEQATPYATLHCANWNVDQASALYITTAGFARALGIAPEKWVFALGSAESNHMETVTSRPMLHRSPGVQIAAAALLDSAGLSAPQVDLLELYSCFPVAVDIVAQEMDLERTRALSITGGMAFAGGPFNNYVLHSTGQMIETLRRERGKTGLVGCISGIMTKQGFGLWSSAPPRRPFESSDVTLEVATQAAPRVEADQYHGSARVVAWTVLQSRHAEPRAVVIADTEDGRRCVAFSEDSGLVTSLELHDIGGAVIRVAGGRFTYEQGFS